MIVYRLSLKDKIKGRFIVESVNLVYLFHWCQKIRAFNKIYFQQANKEICDQHITYECI